MSYPLLIVDEEGEAPERAPDLPHESELGLQLGLEDGLPSSSVLFHLYDDFVG